MFHKTKFLLLCIIILGAFFRLYGLNWDQGFKLHPDERAIIMYSLPLSFPQTTNEFFDKQSPLNPHFFAYGNFPLYLLKITSTIFSAIDVRFGTYDGMHIIGRIISVIADIGTIIVIFFIGRLLFLKWIGLLAAFFYSASVFPIQTSHFYAVDILLTFFITTTIYHTLVFYKHPTKKRAVLVGLFFGLALVTKISAITLAIALFATLFVDFLLLVMRQPHKPRHWFPHIPVFLKRLGVEGGVIVLVTSLTFLLLQPYALIDFTAFLDQNKLQSEMTHNAFIFPYTLQYVGKIPYIYELKNIFFFGLGPMMAISGLAGFVVFLLFLIKDNHPGKRSLFLVYVTFGIVYFLLVGKFAVGWMRYMLPLYPYFAIFAAVLIYTIGKHIKQIYIRATYYILLATFLLVWPVSFMHIYTQPNTRVAASTWINNNIPAGKTLALEHWDDSLPLFGQENYRTQTLALYDTDSDIKWQTIHNQLAQSDYIILASNRLYVPLQKLTDCQNLPTGKCYKQTANYYKNLFAGNLGFKKVAEFSAAPNIPFTNITIDDQSADEAFTVYDHPKVIIFKKTQ